MGKELTVTFLLCLSVPYSVYSDDMEDFRQFYGDEKTIGIATGYARPLTDSPSVVSIITADDIKKMGADSIEEVLETVPGFHVSSAAGFVPVYTIRGIFSPLVSHVLVMQDGIPINEPVNAGKLFTYTHLTKNISRIEIIRGPGSALYGADAFSGVVNIITKRGEEIEGAEIGGLTGSFDTYGGWALLGKKLDDFDISFSAQGKTTKGHRKTVQADAQSRLDRLFNTQASLAPGPVNVDREDIDLAFAMHYKDNFDLYLRYQTAESGNGVGTSLALDPEGNVAHQSFTSGLRAKNRLGNFEHHFDLNYFFNEVKILNHHFPAGAFAGTFTDPVTSTASYLSHNVDVAFKTIYDGIKHHRLYVGAGYKYAIAFDIKENRNFLIAPNNFIVPAGALQSTDSLGVKPFAETTDRHIIYGFIQDEWQFANDWTLTTGVRLDHYSDFGLTVNPRASLVWHIDPSLSTKLMYGRAFRAPSFLELQANQGLLIQGNPDLDPEIIDTVEFSIQKKWQHNFSTDINLFWYSSDDLISETSNNFRTFTNSAGAEGYGFELISKYVFNDQFSIDLNYTFLTLDPKSNNNDSFIVAAPEHDIFAKLNWEFFQDWHINLRSNWILGRQRASNDQRNAIGDYVLVGMTLRRENVLSGLSLTFKADNLFDVQAHHPSVNGLDIPGDYPVAGISFTGLMEFKF